MARDQRHRGDDVGRRHQALDEEDGAVQLQRVEAAQHQVVEGEEQDADAEQRERRHVGVHAALGRGAVREDHPGQVGRDHGQQRDEGHDHRERCTQRARQRARQRRAVTGGRVRRERGSIAVASETVTIEWGTITTRKLKE